MEKVSFAYDDNIIDPCFDGAFKAIIFASEKICSHPSVFLPSEGAANP